MRSVERIGEERRTGKERAWEVRRKREGEERRGEGRGWRRVMMKI